MNGGEKVLPNGQMSPRQSHFSGGIISPGCQQTWDFMIYDCRKSDRPRLISPGKMGFTDSVITIIGLGTDRPCSSDRSVRCWSRRNLISHFAFAGQMKPGNNAGMG